MGRVEESNKEVFKVENICHSFFSKKEETRVIDNVNFSVSKNEFVAIVGPSGCGKSTLLNLMSGIIKPTEGSIELLGHSITDIDRSVGYIAQKDTLLPWRTVQKNVEVGMEIRGISKRERSRIALDLIKKADLSGFEKSYPHELSGGMRKRVDIIKILATDPDVIFMDEPFSSLDIFTREVLQKYILGVWSEHKKTIIFITHDLTEAITLADRVLVFSKRPSRLKSQYTIDLDRPRDPEKLRFDENFIQIYKSIWEDLKTEVEV